MGGQTHHYIFLRLITLLRHNQSASFTLTSSVKFFRSFSDNFASVLFFCISCQLLDQS